MTQCVKYLKCFVHAYPTLMFRSLCATFDVVLDRETLLVREKKADRAVFKALSILHIGRWKGCVRKAKKKAAVAMLISHLSSEKNLPFLFSESEKIKFPNFFLLIFDVIFKSVSTVNFYYPTTPFYTHLSLTLPTYLRHKEWFCGKLKVFLRIFVLDLIRCDHWAEATFNGVAIFQPRVSFFPGLHRRVGGLFGELFQRL